jgi:hypothetical protein
MSRRLQFAAKAAHSSLVGFFIAPYQEGERKDRGEVTLNEAADTGSQPPFRSSATAREVTSPSSCAVRRAVAALGSAGYSVEDPQACRVSPLRSHRERRRGPAPQLWLARHGRHGSDLVRTPRNATAGSSTEWIVWCSSARSDFPGTRRSPGSKQRRRKRRRAGVLDRRHSFRKMAGLRTAKRSRGWRRRPVLRLDPQIRSINPVVPYDFHVPRCCKSLNSPNRADCHDIDQADSK